MICHWSDNWLGKIYNEESFNCADLVLAVQKEQFGRCVDIIGVHPIGPLSQSKAIEEEVWKRVIEVNTPIDGDVVILKNRGRLRHIGVFCEISDGMILHAVKGAGVIRTAVRDLSQIKMELKGYFRPC